MDTAAHPAGPPVEPPLELSVILSTRNRRDVLLSKCLPSVFAQDLSPDRFEVIVIVDGSADGTADALRQLDSPWPLRIHQQPNGGLSRARNTGIRIARARLVLFLDDDFVLSPEVFRLHVEAHSRIGSGTEARSTGQGLVTHGAIYLGEGSPPSLLTNANRRWYLRYNQRLAAEGGAVWPEGVFLLSNSAMPRALLLASGGLDEDLHAMDDFELGLRLWRQGVRFHYLPDAIGYELSVKSWHSFLFSDGEAFGRTAVILSRKYPSFRATSPLLSGMGRTTWQRRTLRSAAMRCPLSPAYLLVPAIWLCDKLCRFPSAQRTGLLLLEIARRLTELRAALRETGSWKAMKHEFAVRLPVLLYHNVGPARLGTYRSLTVSPQKFARQMRWLARRGFHAICPQDWHRWRTRGTPLPDKPILITFDDGYQDLAQHAFPVLRDCGFNAAVFLVSRQVGGTNSWDQAAGSAALHLLTEQQVRQWTGEGIEFGSHSRTHPDLTTVTPAQLEQEVVGSQSDLQQLLGQPVTCFAYPYGSLNDAAADCAAAYDLAFAIHPRERGINHLLTDPRRLRRTMVQPRDTVLDLACRAYMGFSPIAHLRARLRLRTRLKHAARIFSRKADRSPDD